MGFGLPSLRGKLKLTQGHGREALLLPITLVLAPFLVWYFDVIVGSNYIVFDPEMQKGQAPLEDLMEYKLIPLYNGKTGELCAYRKVKVTPDTK
jgi:hypothetical protein